MEVFGDTVTGAHAAVGSGIKAFRDPLLVEDFVAEPRDLDVTAWHTYAARRSPGRVEACPSTASPPGRSTRRRTTRCS